MKTIKIGPTVVPIVVHEKACSSFEILGECSTIPHPEIRLRALSTPFEYITLLHECIHLISDFYDLNLSEAQVRALDQGISMLLKDNPKLLKGMLGE